MARIGDNVKGRPPVEVERILDTVIHDNLGTNPGQLRKARSGDSLSALSPQLLSATAALFNAKAALRHKWDQNPDIVDPGVGELR